MKSNVVPTPSCHPNPLSLPDWCAALLLCYAGDDREEDAPSACCARGHGWCHQCLCVGQAAQGPCISFCMEHLSHMRCVRVLGHEGFKMSVLSPAWSFQCDFQELLPVLRSATWLCACSWLCAFSSVAFIHGVHTHGKAGGRGNSADVVLERLNPHLTA